MTTPQTIYNEAIEKLKQVEQKAWQDWESGGYTPANGIKIEAPDFVMNFGGAHIVWSDYNMGHSDIRWSIKYIESGQGSTNTTPEQDEIILWSLRELLKLPEDELEIYEEIE